MIMQQRVIASSFLSVSFLAVACVLSVFPGRGLAQEPTDPTDRTDLTDPTNPTDPTDPTDPITIMERHHGTNDRLVR
jgi:hypothetical protein